MSESRPRVNGRSSLPLGRAPCGFRGRVDAIEVPADRSGLPACEIESRLIELGFVEGARIEVSQSLHIGATVSVGTVCSRGQIPLEAKALIDAADRKLYEAKRLGRNRVCSELATDAEVTRDLPGGGWHAGPYRRQD